MSIDATRWAWQQELKPTQKLLLLSLADRADEKSTCYPSTARIEHDTGLNRKTIFKVVSELEEMGLLEVIRGLGKGNYYQLIGVQNRHETSPKNGTASRAKTSPKKGTSTKNGTSPKNGTDQSQKRDSNQYQKRYIEPINEPINNPKEEKETKPKDKFFLPDFVNPTAWTEFEKHRKEIKKPLTDMARTKAANLLEGLTQEQQQEVIDYSIAGRYTGLFPDRIKDKGNHHETHQPTNKPKTRREHHAEISEHIDRKFAAAFAPEMDGSLN